MKIATWNVNSVRKRTGNLVAWLEHAKPDVVVLQELKAQEPQFPRLEVEAAGYKVEIVGQKGFNGVALLSLHPVEITARALPDAGRRRAGALHRRQDRHAPGAAHRGRHLPAQRQSHRHREVRLQDRLDGSPEPARPGAARARGDVRAGRRLQRLPDRDGRLRSQGLRQRRALPAAVAGGLAHAAQSRPDRRRARLPSRRRPATPSGTTRPAPGRRATGCASTTCCCRPRPPTA